MFTRTLIVIIGALSMVDVLIFCYCYYLRVIVMKRISDDCDRLWSESREWAIAISDDYRDDMPPRHIKQ